MKTKTDLRDFYNRKIGSVETDSVTGDQIGRDFYNRIVGYYLKNRDITQDYYRRTVGRGNILSMLIVQENNKKNV